jgi:hypothetical protein
MNWYKIAQNETEDYPEENFSQKIRLWLDDERDPKNPEIQRLYGAAGNEIWVKTAPEAINYLNTKNVKYISLDHDLGNLPGVGSGYDVAKYIEKKCFLKRNITIRMESS